MSYRCVDRSIDRLKWRNVDDNVADVVAVADDADADADAKVLSAPEHRR